MTDEELNDHRPKYWRDKNRRKWTKGSGPIGIETMTYLLANPQTMLWDNNTGKPASAAFVANYPARSLYNCLLRGRYYYACAVQANKETGA